MHTQRRRIVSAKKLAILVSIFTVAMTEFAMADDRNAYVGFAAGFSKTDLKPSDVEASLVGSGVSATTSVDDSDKGIKVYGGFMANRYLGFELAYVDLGRFRFHSNTTSTGSGTFFGGDSTAHSFDFTMLGVVPLGESFSLLGRGGFSVWQVKVESNRTVAGGAIATSADESGVSPVLGLGAAYRIAPHISLRLEAERHFGVGGEETLGKKDIDLFSVAVQFHF
jgi:OOP family OmpA-OmpF porin